MNERIQALMNQAMESTGVEGLGGSYMELNPEKFAKLIVEESANEIISMATKYASFNGDPRAIINHTAISKKLKEHFGVPEGNDDLETDDPIKNRDSLMKSVAKLRALSKCDDIEPRGWVCPKCGIDRTKAACPNGHHAALTGQCPLVGVAL